MRLMNALVLLVILVSAGCQGGQPFQQHDTPESPPDDWVAADHDFRHTNRSPFAGPTDPRVKWTYSLESGSFRVSQITDDGRFYATCGRLLLAFDRHGEVLWQAEANEAYDSAPTVSPDGTVYTGGELLRAYSPDGELRWFAPPLRGTFGAPAAGQNGSIYVAGTGSLYRFSADGEMLWANSLAGEVQHAPLVDPDGRVYVRELDQGYDILLVFSASGAAIENIYWPDTSLSNPTLSDSGWLYFVSFDQTQLDIADDDDFPIDYYSELHAVNMGTSASWTREIAGREPLSVLAGFDGTVYVLTNDLGAITSDMGGALYRFSAQGELLAQTDNPAYYTQELVSIAPDGRVFTRSNNIDSPDFFGQIFNADGLVTYYEVSDKSHPYPPVYFSPSGDNITVDGGQGRSGLLEYRGPAGGLQWSYHAGQGGGQVLLSPKDGVILSGARIWQFSRAGQMLGSTEPETPYSYQSPAIGSDGTIYAIATRRETSGSFSVVVETYLTAISSGGQEIWRQPIETDSSSYGPLLAPDGSMYVATYEGIMSFAADGGLEWKLLPEDYFGISSRYPMPAVADDGTLYLSYRVRNSTESFNCLAAVSPDGTLKWQHYSDLRPDSIVLTDDGGVLVITAGGVSSFGSDGALQWEAESSSPLSRRSSITRDGHLLVASATYAYPEPVHSALLCLAPDGQWVPDRQLDFAAGIYLFDVVSDDEGRLYLAQGALPAEAGTLAEQSGVYAYSESGELLWRYLTDEPAGGLAIGSDKTLYFTSNSRLYALAD